MPILLPSDINTTEIAAFKNDYAADIYMLLQQKGSMLRMTARPETINGERLFVNQIGKVEARTRVNFKADLEYKETPHARREVRWTNKYYAELLTPVSKIAMQRDLSGTYLQQGVYALGREIDDYLVNAFDGVVMSGKDGDVPIAFPTSQVVDLGTAGTPPTSGLTIDKLREVRERFDVAEVQPDEEIYFVIDARAKRQLLETTEITNSDYAAVKALVQGQVDTFMGFKFVTCQRTKKFNLDGTTGATASNASWGRAMAYTRNALVLGIAADVTSQIDWLPQKQAWQVYADLHMGAVRMEEERCVAVDYAYNPTP